MAKTILFVILVVCLLAWSPWMEPLKSEQAVSRVFTREWKGVTDGCSQVRFEQTRKVLFGFATELLYECGIPAGQNREPLRAQVFISAFYTVHWIHGYDLNDLRIAKYIKESEH